MEFLVSPYIERDQKKIERLLNKEDIKVIFVI